MPNRIYSDADIAPLPYTIAIPEVISGTDGASVARCMAAKRVRARVFRVRTGRFTRARPVAFETRAMVELGIVLGFAFAPVVWALAILG